MIDNFFWLKANNEFKLSLDGKARVKVLWNLKKFLLKVSWKANLFTLKFLLAIERGTIELK